MRRPDVRGEGSDVRQGVDAPEMTDELAPDPVQEEREETFAEAFDRLFPEFKRASDAPPHRVYEPLGDDVPF